MIRVIIRRQVKDIEKVPVLLRELRMKAIGFPGYVSGETLVGAENPSTVHQTRRLIMWHIGIDLHRRTLVMAAIKDDGEVIDPLRIDCQDTATILEAVEDIKPFQAVIEASGTYRWLYDLLSPHGTVLLAHPLRLRAMIQRRTKTDKLDAQLLANLLRIDQIPLAYVPPKHYQALRELTRCRARLIRG